jgi:DNA primase
MPFIGDEQVRQIKSRIDLVQLMGEYTPLRKAGANFSGCCPFHQERTPSMHVYTDQQTYHCFGCGAHGDAITLVREKERVDFADAVELLARRAGITIAYQDQGRSQMARGERDGLIAAVEFAVAFYERMLWESDGGAEAREYLVKRALSHAVIKRFRLGWSPGHSTLVDEARRKGLDVNLLMKTDLAVERNGRPADRFYERVMFPLDDRFGNPIAFSARLLPAAERQAKEEGRGVGKYVNNTDTPLYHKGSAVFNLHRARTVCRDRNRLIVMEGPADVIAADEAGFGECVAVLGTALTSEHARQIGNLVGGAGRLIIMLDGDRAGQANALKAIRTCLAVGVPVRVATLPDELDPAELLIETDDRERGRQVMEEVLAAARGDIDHLLRSLAPRPYALDNREKLAVTDQVLEALRPMPDAELRRLHLRDVAAYLNIEQDRLERRLAGGPAKPVPPAAAGGEASPAATVAELDQSQELILHILVRCPELRALAGDDLGLEPSHFPAPWDALAGHLLLETGADVHALVALPEVQANPAVNDAVFRWANTDLATREPVVGDPRQSLTEAVRSRRSGPIRDAIHRLSLEIAEAEKARDFTLLGRLDAEKRELIRTKRDLEGSNVVDGQEEGSSGGPAP